MIRRWLRGLIREELEEMREDMAARLADLIVRNNEQIEKDLVEAGVVELEDGRLKRHACGS